MKRHDADGCECCLLLHTDESLYIIGQNDIRIQVEPGKALSSFFPDEPQSISHFYENMRDTDLTGSRDNFSFERISLLKVSNLFLQPKNHIVQSNHLPNDSKTVHFLALTKGPVL